MTLQSNETRFLARVRSASAAVAHWWNGLTPTGKCLCAVGAALVVILVLVLV